LVKGKWAMVTVTAVFLAAQVAIILALAYKGRFDYMRSVLVTTAFWVIYSLLECRYGLYMSTYVRVLMVLSIFCDAFGGYYLDLYVTSFVFDKVLHVFGTYSFALFAWVLVTQLLAYPLAKPVTFILVASLGLSLGAFYEILEFFTDSISHPVPPSQPSLLDTDLDIIGNAVGALIAALHAISRNFVGRDF
jgi:hypothetical protein